MLCTAIPMYIRVTESRSTQFIRKIEKSAPYFKIICMVTTLPEQNP